MGPSLNHSYICKRILLEIEHSGKWEAWPELTLDIESGVVPDIAVYESGVLKPDFDEDKVRCDVLPKVVVEVVSPSQPIHELMVKAGKYLKAGVPAVWTVEPYGGVIYVSTKEGRSVFVAEAVKSEGVELDFSKIFG